MDTKALELQREEKVKILVKNGGYKLVQDLNKNLKYFSPGASENLKSMFLEESDFDSQRNELKNTVNSLLGILKESKNAQEAVAAAESKSEEANALINSNLAKIVEKGSGIEKSYRQLQVFYQNAGTGEIENIRIVNVDEAMLRDEDDEVVNAKIKEIISDPDLSIDQDRVFTFLVIPGFLGEKLIQVYSKIADEHKVLLLTDYKDLASVEELRDYRTSPRGELIGGVQAEWSRTVVFANYLRMREKYGALGENEDLFGSPAMAAAGKLFGNNIAQPAAGVEHGSLSGVDGMRITRINEVEVNQLAEIGLNPIIKAFGKIMPFNASSLYSGATTELKHYSIVRTFDYMDKCLKHFLNQNIWAVIDSSKAGLIHKNILHFLKELEENKVIEKGNILNFKKDKNKPDVIHLELDIKPLYAVRSFMFKLAVSKESNAEITKE